MTPHDIIYDVLLRDHDIHHADQLTDEILARIAADGFVVVHAKAVIQQDGKVTVTRTLLESVLEDAEKLVASEYFLSNGDIHPSERRRYLRDMEDIWKLKAELREAGDV